MYKSIFSKSPVGISIYDKTGQCIEANDSIARLFGASKAQVIEQNYNHIESWKESGLLDKVKGALSDKKLKRHQLFCKTTSGISVKLDCHLVPITSGGLLLMANDVTGSQKTENKLRESEKKFRSLFNNCPMGIFIYELKQDGALIFQNANQSADIILGVNCQQFVGKTIEEAFPPLADTEIPARYKQAAITGEIWETEQVDYSHGEIRGAYKVVAFQTKPNEMACMFEDITERKQAEEALRYERDLIQRIMETSPAGVVHVDANGKVFFANKRAEEVLGIQSSKVKQRTYNDPEWKITDLDGELFPEENLPFNIVKRTGKPVSGIQHAIQWPDGRRVLLSINSAPLIHTGGKFEGMVSTIEDITKRKQDEQTLKESEERFRVLVEQAPVGAALIDKKGNYKYLNPKFVEIFGYSLEQISTGRDWFRKAFPEREYRHDVISSWIKDKKDYGTGESRPRTFVVTCGDGSNKSISFKPVSLHSGEQFIIYEDITETKKLEDQLRQSQKMEAIGTLAGGIAHDFNNILSIIVGNAELALDDVPEWNPAHQNIQEIHRACLRARDVIKQMLAFSRQTKYELKPLKLAQLIQDSLKLIRASIPTTIEIHQNFENNSDVIRGDPTQLNQVMINLCTNAAHAMREKGGLLKVGLEHIKPDKNIAAADYDLPQGKLVRLSITDTGHGIAPEVIERIFDPYYTTKSVGEGTGMGLAVVHGIVKNHGGKITVKSEPGTGTRFDIILPVVDAEPEPEAKLSKKLPRGTERILFVDDEQEIVIPIKQILERLGYKVDARMDSSEALEVFRIKPEAFDLVITDQTMPNMTGVALAKALITIRPNIPVILCTGFSQSINEATAKEIGIKSFIMKPIMLHEMAAIIRDVLDHND